MATTPPSNSATTKPKPKTARKPRTAAKQSTRTTASAASSASRNSTQPATRAARAQQIAERAVLIPIGAALEARDRVAGTVGELVAPVRSRNALETQLTRFERRGNRARTQLEREVRRTRTRIERSRRQAGRNLVPNVEVVTTRVENVVQNGVNAGIKLVNGAQDRITRAA